MSSCPPHSAEISAPEIELDPPAAGLGPRLRKALKRVVVGEREARDAGLGHAADQVRRRIEAVGDGRVAVEVELHGRGV